VDYKGKKVIVENDEGNNQKKRYVNMVNKKNMKSKDNKKK
jgi:hypothetical protein